jgi:prepilin-type N-terminal cleavage/methylation domain-containing protein
MRLSDDMIRTPLAILGQRIRSERGFTMTELLIVMVILSILFMLAVPSYLDRRIKAQDVVAHTDARSLLRFVEACATEYGQYVDDDPTDTEYFCDDRPGIGEAYSGEVAPSDPAELQVWFDALTHLRYGWGPGEVELDPCQEDQQVQNLAADPAWSCGAGEEGFFVIAKSRSGNFFYLRKIIGAGGGIDQLCTTAGIGACRGDGTW